MNMQIHVLLGTIYFFPLIMPAKDLRRYGNSTFFQTVAFFFFLIENESN